MGDRGSPGEGKVLGCRCVLGQGRKAMQINRRPDRGSSLGLQKSASHGHSCLSKRLGNGIQRQVLFFFL